MKVGLRFENQGELLKRIPVNFIAEIWANKDGWNALTLSTKIRLKQYGYDQEQVDSFKPLISKAKRWAWQTGIPDNAVIDAEELGQWEHVKNVSSIIASV